MLTVEDWAEVRRLHRAEKMPVKAIVRALGKLDDGYARALRWVLHHRALTICAILGLFVLGAASFVPLGQIVAERLRVFPPRCTGAGRVAEWTEFARRAGWF